MTLNARSSSGHFLGVVWCAVVALLVASCGQTRYVIVETPNAAVPVAATTPLPGTSAPESTASTITPDLIDTTEPTTSMDPLEERNQIESVLFAAFSPDLDVPFSERTDFIDNGADLEITFEAITNLLEGFDTEIHISSVAVAGDTAIATVAVFVDGEEFASGLPVDFVGGNDNWKVTRGGACVLLALAAPCPEL